jgi:diguanylate cyclase (GGDEF)-like protein
LIRSLLSRPDEVMLELGAGGELLVARLRGALSALVLLLPLAGALAGADASETAIGLGAAVFINAMAQVWLALARNSRAHAWLPWVTCAWDITTVTCVLALLALGDRAAGLNSMVVWAFYLVAIAMTALRNDGRLTLFTGGLAMAQYAALVLLVFTASSSQQLVSADYGTVTLANQLERVLLLAIMSLLMLAVVRRMQRLVELSGRDAVTGLPNRRWLRQHALKRLERLPRDGSLTVALLDIDRFRAINEELGVQDADRAMRHLVMVAGKRLHERERMARLGRDEFALLLDCPIGTAWERMEQLRTALAAEPFMPGRGADPLALTVSIGLAAWPRDGGDLPALLGAADRRLEACRHSGGDRVVARDH